MKTQKIKYIQGALYLAVIIFSIAQAFNPQKMMDFQSVYCTALSIRTGAPIQTTCAGTVMYDSTIKGLPYPNMIMMPATLLTYMPYQAAAVTWATFKACLIITLIYAGGLIHGLILILIFSGALFSDTGNMTLVIVMLVIFGYHLAARGSPIGLYIIAFAALFKYYPIIALTPFLFNKKLKGSAMAAGAIWMAWVLTEYFFFTRGLDYVLGNKWFYFQNIQQWALATTMLALACMGQKIKDMPPNATCCLFAIFWVIPYPSIYNFVWIAVPIAALLSVMHKNLAIAIAAVVALLLSTHQGITRHYDSLYVQAFVFTLYVIYESLEQYISKLKGGEKLWKQ